MSCIVTRHMSFFLKHCVHRSECSVILNSEHPENVFTSDYHKVMIDRRETDLSACTFFSMLLWILHRLQTEAFGSFPLPNVDSLIRFSVGHSN